MKGDTRCLEERGDPEEKEEEDEEEKELLFLIEKTKSEREFDDKYLRERDFPKEERNVHLIAREETESVERFLTRFQEDHQNRALRVPIRQCSSRAFL